jgi:hypothetical protein
MIEDSGCGSACLGPACLCTACLGTTCTSAGRESYYHNSTPSQYKLSTETSAIKVNQTQTHLEIKSYVCCSQFDLIVSIALICLGSLTIQHTLFILFYL